MNENLKAMASPTEQAQSEVRNMMIYAIILSVVTVI
jgi:hypothetical protein